MKSLEETLKEMLISEYGSSTMDLIDKYANGEISKFKLSKELGSSAMDLADRYKKAKEYNRRFDTFKLPVDFETQDCKTIESYVDKNREMLVSLDAQLKEKGEVLFRILSFPVADSFAIYQITDISTKTKNATLL